MFVIFTGKNTESTWKCNKDLKKIFYGKSKRMIEKVVPPNSVFFNLTKKRPAT